MLRHVPLIANGHELPLIASMSGEFRRIIAMTASNGSTGSRSLLLIDPTRLDPHQINEISGRLGIPVRAKTPREIFGNEPAAAGNGERPRPSRWAWPRRNNNFRSILSIPS